MNVIDINTNNNLKKNFITQKRTKKNKNASLKKLSNKFSKKRNLLKRGARRFFNSRITTELEVVKKNFYKYLNKIVKIQNNFYPNQIYLWYNKTPNNIFNNIYLPYITFLLYTNTDYVINVKSYWKKIQKKIKNIQKTDPEFNPNLKKAILLIN